MTIEFVIYRTFVAPYDLKVRDFVCMTTLDLFFSESLFYGGYGKDLDGPTLSNKVRHLKSASYRQFYSNRICSF